MSERFEEFHDPALKAAMKRALGDHRADPAMQRRIADAIGRDSSHSAQTEQPDSMRLHTRRWWFAYAASILLAITLIAVQTIREQLEETEYLRINQPTLSVMIDMHDGKLTTISPGFEAELTMRDPKSLGEELSRRLGRNIVVPDLSAQGWRITSATVRPMLSQNFAHVQYKSKDRTLSFLSLPLRALSGSTERPGYDLSLDGHALVGVVGSDGVHCLVGGSDVKQSELRDLRGSLNTK